MAARLLYQHPILRLESFPVMTSAGEREYVRLRFADWVNVLPITADGQALLVRQHRWGIEASSLEVPGGAVDPGEDPGVAAARELREETGYGGGALRSLGWVWANPAIQDNRTWLFVAEGVSLEGEPDRGAGEEDLTVERVPVADLRRLLADGTLSHALAVVTVQRFLLGL